MCPYCVLPKEEAGLHRLLSRAVLGSSNSTGASPTIRSFPGQSNVKEVALKATKHATPMGQPPLRIKSNRALIRAADLERDHFGREAQFF